VRGFVANRLVDTVLTCVAISFVVFAFLHLAGDPAKVLLPPEASKEAVAELRRALGLEDPFLLQDGRFLAHAARGDFGDSFIIRDKAVLIFLERAPATVELAVAGLVLAVVISVHSGSSRRVVRAEVLSLREREFVIAEEGLGASPLRILLAHVTPNVANLIMVLASVEIARMIIVESFLSYLGLGVPPPVPSWGGMLSEGQLYVLTKWWLATFPGLAILVTVLGVNLIGDALRDLLDPHLKTVKAA
jgi:ABC-type dipeptide/oligopeptide/nickel transport system permease subunit